MALDLAADLAISQIFFCWSVAPSRSVFLAQQTWRDACRAQITIPVDSPLGGPYFCLVIEIGNPCNQMKADVATTGLSFILGPSASSPQYPPIM